MVGFVLPAFPLATVHTLYGYRADGAGGRIETTGIHDKANIDRHLCGEQTGAIDTGDALFRLRVVAKDLGDETLARAGIEHALKDIGLVAVSICGFGDTLDGDRVFLRARNGVSALGYAYMKRRATCAEKLKAAGAVK